MQIRNLHYAWIIIFAGILTLFCCMGLGRFALGMLLPSMGTSLSLSYTEMGLISTGNFVGYLLSVFFCGSMISRLGERNTITAGLALITISMLLVSLSDNVWLIISLYFFTGIGSGAANITVMTLVAHWFDKRFRGQAAGYMIIGNGLGIVASGILIPILNQYWPENGWRISWGAFALTVALVTAVVVMLIRNTPQELKLKPFGDSSSATPSNPNSNQQNVSLKRIIGHIGTIYLMFGFTYVIYTTFIVTTLVEQYAYTEASAGQLWMIIGIISAFSGALFGWVSDRFGRKTGLFIVFTMQTASYLLAASEPGQNLLILSMLLFGLTAFSIPAIIAATISDLLPPLQAGQVFGYVTFFFGVGQITGPTIAGYLAEQSQSFSPAYLLAALMTAVGVILTLALKHKPSD